MATKAETTKEPKVKTTSVETETVEAVAVKPAKKVTKGLSVPMINLKGETIGDQELPVEIFGTKPNKTVLAQALRVYMNNQQSHWGNTKTRGEVDGSTKKIYRQKGTGGARHGSKRAPIFVKGGIALGPKFRKVNLDLPQKMKNAALISALSQKVLDGEVMVVSGFDKATGKTKEMAGLVKGLNKKSILVVTDSSEKVAGRGLRNLTATQMLQAVNLNAFQAVSCQSLLLTPEAVAKLVTRIEGKLNQEVAANA